MKTVTKLYERQPLFNVISRYVFRGILFSSIVTPEISYAQVASLHSHPEIIHTLPCRDVSRKAIMNGGYWAHGQVGFGIPFEQWTRQDFGQLRARFDECQSSAGIDPKWRVAPDSELGILASMAPDPDAAAKMAVEQQRRQGDQQRAMAAEQNQAKLQAETDKADQQRREVVEEQLRQTAAAKARADTIAEQQKAVAADQAATDEAASNAKAAQLVQAQADKRAAETIAAAKTQQSEADSAADEAMKSMPQPPSFDCKAPATLDKVKETLNQQPDTKVLKVYGGRGNPEFAEYLSASATEKVKVALHIRSVPQCLFTVITVNGQTDYSARLFDAGGEPFVEVRELVQ